MQDLGGPASTTTAMGEMTTGTTGTTMTMGETATAATATRVIETAERDARNLADRELTCELTAKFRGRPERAAPHHIYDVMCEAEMREVERIIRRLRRSIATFETSRVLRAVDQLDRALIALLRLRDVDVMYDTWWPTIGSDLPMMPERRVGKVFPLDKARDGERISAMRKQRGNCAK